MNETFTMDQMRAIVAYELSKEAPVLNTEMSLPSPILSST